MPIVLKSGSFNLREPSGPVQAFTEIALPFIFAPKRARQQDGLLTNRQHNMTLILLQEIAPPVQSNRTIGGSHSRSGRSEMAKKSSPRPVTELRTHSPYCNHDDDISRVFITSTRDFIRILYMFHASEPNSTDISMTVKS